MKKHMRICAIAAAFFCLTALFGCGADYYKGYKETYYSAYDSTNYASGGVKIDKTVTEIDIDWLSGNVDIKTADAETIDFYEKQNGNDGEISDEELRLRYYVDGTALKIKFAAPRKAIPLHFEKTLTITMPVGVTLNEVEVENVSGGVNITAVAALKLDVETVSGKIFASDCKAYEADLSSVSGDVYCGGNVGSLDIKTTSGKSEFLGSAEKFDISTVSGNIALSFNDNPIDGEIESTSGAVVFSVAGEKNFKIKYETTSGKYVSEVKHSVEGKYKVFGTGAHTYEIETVSGNLTIK